MRPGAFPLVGGGVWFSRWYVVSIDPGHIAQSSQSSPGWSPAFKMEPVLFPPSINSSQRSHQALKSTVILKFCSYLNLQCPNIFIPQHIKKLQSSINNSHLKALSLLSPHGKFFSPVSDQQSCPNVIPLEMLSWPTLLKNSKPFPITYLVKNIYTLSQTNYTVCLQLMLFICFFQFLRGGKRCIKICNCNLVFLLLSSALYSCSI